MVFIDPQQQQTYIELPCVLICIIYIINEYFTARFLHVQALIRTHVVSKHCNKTQDDTLSRSVVFAIYNKLIFLKPLQELYTFALYVCDRPS